MRRRANPMTFLLRIVLCLLGLVISMPPCSAQFPAAHGEMAGMDCCARTTVIGAPQGCCTLHPQPAEVNRTVAISSWPAMSSRLLIEGNVIVDGFPQGNRTSANPPPLLHPNLRI